MLKILTGLLLALSLFACGGGGSDTHIAPATANRTDLLYGYYGADATQVSETAAHTNLLWESQFFGLDVAYANIAEAKMATVLDVSHQVYLPFACQKKCYANPQGAPELRAVFAELSARGLLQYVVAISPLDEPDARANSAEDVHAVNVVIREVAAEFPELSDVKLIVIYTKNNRFTHIGDFDIVAFDAYFEKSGIFAAGGQYDYMRSLMRNDQQTAIVSGGTFGQDPVPFLNFAETHPEVWAMISFIWFSAGDMTGIKNSTLRVAYCKAGLVATGKTGVCL